MKNLQLKILSVIIAISLWLGLVSGEYMDFTVYAPVRIKNMRGELVAVASDTHVNVHAKIPKGLMHVVDYNSIVIDVDASDMELGDTFHRISQGEVKIPSGVELVRVEPEGVNITVDKLVKKSIKVVPTFIGESHPGFKVSSVTVYPEYVEVQGADKKIQAINFIETKPVNISSKKEGMTSSIGIKDTEGVISSSPEQVEVYVSFVENIINASIDNISISSINLDDDLTAFIADTLTVNVSGRSDLLAAENVRKKLKYYVDLHNVEKPGVYTFNVHSAGAEEYTINKVYPRKIRVKVEHKR